ncbi:MAG: alpha/beta fold hydrolase [Solirubrobacteraceae bacterium]|nr:alpha/beta fold hydrolase [Solirubrobacteraceae bacterium]
MQLHRRRPPRRSTRARALAHRARRELLAPAAPSREQALRQSERLGALTHLAASAEYLARPRDRRAGGSNDWDVMRRVAHVRFPRFAPVLDAVADRRVTSALHGGRIAAALALLAPTPRPVRLAADAALATSSALLYPRHHYGTDGTDQVAFLVQTTATAARIGERRPEVVDAALWSLAIQGGLSYGISGWVKLTGRSWRSGEALAGVTRTRTYGERRAWTFFDRHPKIARVLGAQVLAAECLFPLAFTPGGRLAPALTHGATLFHLVNARIMGLGRFVPAFGALHPPIRYVTAPQNDAAPRDDTLPKVVGATAVAATAGGLIAAARRRRIVNSGRDDEQTIRTRAGNRLVFRRVGRPRNEDAPVVVLEHGLMSCAEHWEWVTEKLAADHQVIVYSRAGYGRSARDSRAPFGFDQSVSDLLDLTAAAGAGRRAVLVGHSLGGWLAVRAAAAAPDRVAGVVLLDSSHPAELDRSSRQAQGTVPLTENLSLMPMSLRLGLGGLLATPDWVRQLPERVRKLALAQYRDARLWTAGLREWNAVLEEFEAFDGELEHIEAPVLALTAGYTARNDPVQQELHAELAGTSPRSRHEIIDGADHDNVLFDERIAQQTADLVDAFIADLPTPTREEAPAHALVAR